MLAGRKVGVQQADRQHRPPDGLGDTVGRPKLDGDGAPGSEQQGHEGGREQDAHADRQRRQDAEDARQHGADRVGQGQARQHVQLPPDSNNMTTNGDVPAADPAHNEYEFSVSDQEGLDNGNGEGEWEELYSDGEGLGEHASDEDGLGNGGHACEDDFGNMGQGGGVSDQQGPETGNRGEGGYDMDTDQGDMGEGGEVYNGGGDQWEGDIHQGVGIRGDGDDVYNHGDGGDQGEDDIADVYDEQLRGEPVGGDGGGLANAK